MVEEYESELVTPEIIKKNIKYQLIRLRVENKLSKREVAKALNIKENTYRIWEDPNRSCPKPHDIVNLALIYNVPTDVILSDENGKPLDKIFKRNMYNTGKKEMNLTSLDSYEKLLVMTVRRLSFEEKKKLSEEIYRLLSE